MWSYPTVTVSGVSHPRDGLVGDRTRCRGVPRDEARSRTLSSTVRDVRGPTVHGVEQTGPRVTGVVPIRTRRRLP